MNPATRPDPTPRADRCSRSQPRAGRPSPFLGVRARGKNEAINVGRIGFGGRCRPLVAAPAKLPDGRIGAVCDIYGPNLEESHSDVNIALIIHRFRASSMAGFIRGPRRSLARIFPSGPMRNVAGMAVAP
jgi:hypothetical protein